MSFITIMKISLRAIRANKVRTGLTVLGIVIGIASVIIVYSAGEGINGLVMSQVESFGGTDLIETEVKAPTGKKGVAAEQQSAIAIAQGAQITTLSLKDFADVEKLLILLNQLVDAGNTVFVVEHNLDVIRNSDWVIDLGPEGGDEGGYLVAQGLPKEITKVNASYTGKYLASQGHALRS